MRWWRWRSYSAIWVVPLIYAAAATAASVLLPRIEHAWWPAMTSGVSTSSATAIYSAVASGTMALMAIVFSLTFLMVQFSATAYSPRIVLWLARDPMIAHALGAFTATFLYALAALAWVDRRGSDTVPPVSAMVVVALLVLSIGMFIGLIQRIALLQIHRMLTFIGDRGRRVIETLYPDPFGETEEPAGGRLAGRDTHVVVHRGRPAAVQAVDIPLLVEQARVAGGFIEVLVAVGDTVIDSAPLLRVVDPVRAFDAGVLSRAIVRGVERTFEQDPKYALRLLVDVAIRALSPAINDPTTAVQALDQIGDLLLRLAGRDLQIGACRDAGGIVRVVVPFPAWEDFLRLGFDEIRSYGGASVQVTRRMKALIADLIALVPDSRRLALRNWLARLDRTVAQHFPDPDEFAEASTADPQGLGVPRRSAA